MYRMSTLQVACSLLHKKEGSFTDLEYVSTPILLIFMHTILFQYNDVYMQ